nr:PREDICTED: solute carrier family 13 member 1 [Latimeria chalumnae]|eukprot:XP_006004909.1 PREDICTED: solute carrier family 13 member 1 [Latimeria chalumnae]
MQAQLWLRLHLNIRSKEAECAYTLCVVAVYWLTEAMPLAVTALLPALMFPLFGIMPSNSVASTYFKDFHLLLAGVICLATSIEKWNLHKRIALWMVMLVGVNPGWLMLGFMASTAFLSMWLSNTSTAAMVMPVVEAVIQQIIHTESEVDTMQTKNTNGIINEGLNLDEVMTTSEVKSNQLNGIEGHSSDIDHHTECKVEKEETCKQISFWLAKYNPYPQSISFLLSQHQSAGNEGVHQVHPMDFFTVKAQTAGTMGRYRSKKYHMMCKGMCLCIAYASTIGGLSTITGTSTNLIFAEQFNTRYPECQCINFGSWFVLCMPISLIILFLSWIWLQWLFVGFEFSEMFKCGKEKTIKEKASTQVVKDEYRKLGPLSYQEIVTLIIFVGMALLWFTRDPGFIPGWSSLFPQYKGYATDSTAALLLGLLFFIIPSNRPTSSSFEKKSFSYSTLITWKEFQQCMPWEIVLLVGGGFALAEGCEVSGLSAWIGNILTPLQSLPVWVIILVSSLIVTCITEVASNPATITIFLPVLAPFAEAIQVNPLYLLIPTTLSTSLAFLLPVSNPPNAIVFTYGHLSVRDMVKAGLGVNIIGVAVVMLAVSTWAIPLFDLHTYPSWASTPALNVTQP